VNYLGHWLLAHELLGHARSQGKSSDDAKEGTRVIFLSSTTHRAGRLDFSDLQLERRGAYSGFRGYADSKLACLLAAKEFQRRLDRRA
jgi:NAD(P)-dependent dehydrogenase (short-subunit alcohol dehydrogenase family)